MRDGPPLSGYYTTYPALDSDGNAVFWRDGKLLTINGNLRVRKLFTDQDDRAVMSRVLLLDHGQVILALHDELLIFHNTGLAALDTGKATPSLTNEPRRPTPRPANRSLGT
jgi:hypothetical protein